MLCSLYLGGKELLNLKKHCNFRSSCFKSCFYSKISPSLASTLSHLSGWGEDEHRGRGGVWCLVVQNSLGYKITLR